jgi:hypothetical protein
MGRHSDDRSSAARRDPRLGASPEIPEQVYERVGALCLALPEVTVRVDEPRISARSPAWSYDIRRRSFCLLVAIRDRNGKPSPRLVLRADPQDREALSHSGTHTSARRPAIVIVIALGCGSRTTRTGRRSASW